MALHGFVRGVFFVFGNGNYPEVPSFSPYLFLRLLPLPSTLHNAVKALTEDEVVKAALGNHIYTNFIEAKRIEWASYATFVSQWEIDNYLDLY